MKKIILLISILLFSFEAFSQEETIISINVEDLKQENIIYDIYIAVDLVNESRVYRYLIDNEKINDIVYLSSDPWIKLPIELEFDSDTIEIWYNIKYNSEISIKGEFEEIIDLCYKTEFKFKKFGVGIQIEKERDPLLFIEKEGDSLLILEKE